MSDIVRDVTLKAAHKNKNISEFRAGDTVGVYVRIREGDKDRVQLYKGVVLKIQGSGATKSFTVRKISAGVGVERTFPYFSPSVDRVETISHGKVRRSRLYFLRGLKGKAARLTSELVGLKDDATKAAEALAAKAEKEAAKEAAAE
jgi:large subunit ribosomal protein L19